MNAPRGLRPVTAGGAALPRPGLGIAVVGAAFGCLAVLEGSLAALHPKVAVAPLVAIGLFVLAFRAPATHLFLLLLTTALVGYEVQHSYFGHLLPSDALLVTGLVRAGVVLWRSRLGRASFRAAWLIAAFMIAVLVQLVHGLHAGADPAYAEAEARILMGFGALLIALPMVHEPDDRRRLARALIAVGLLSGLWGLTQWALGITGVNNVDFGVRPAADFAVSGHGQLHGGLYGYPVAVLAAAVPLLSGVARSRWSRVALFLVVLLNLACLILTYERTLWFATVAGFVFVIAKLPRGRRLHAAVFASATAVLLAGLLAAAAPRDFNAVVQRVASSGKGVQDNSVRTRIFETDHVMVKVRQKPLFGWGLGNFLYWGQPWEQHSPKSTWFSHNGYLWMVWKTGVFVALLLFGLLAWAVVRRGPPQGGPSVQAFRTGSQAGLVALLLTSVSFPSFISLNATALMGTLMAVCFVPTAARRRHRVELRDG